MKEYRNSAIIVYWNPDLCAHPGICTKTLPEVFSVERRPWVNVNAAEPEEIIKCVDKCPSGALSYSVPEGSNVDPGLAKGPGSVDYMKGVVALATVKVAANCPIFIEGPTEIFSYNGVPMREGARIALCSCGRSKNAPFCDGTHRCKG